LAGMTSIQYSVDAQHGITFILHIVWLSILCNQYNCVVENGEWIKLLFIVRETVINGCRVSYWRERGWKVFSKISNFSDTFCIQRLDSTTCTINNGVFFLCNFLFTCCFTEYFFSTWCNKGHAAWLQTISTKVSHHMLMVTFIFEWKK